MLVGYVAAILAENEARGQTNFSEYKPYVLHSRDSFMVFSEKLLNPALNNDTARSRRVIDSLVHYAAETKNDELIQNARLLNANFTGFHTAQKQVNCTPL